MNYGKAKEDNRKRYKLFNVKIIHFLITIGLFYIAWLIFRYNQIPQQKDAEFRYNYLVTAGLGALILFFNQTYNSYLFGYSRVRTLVFAQFLSQFFSV